MTDNNFSDSQVFIDGEPVELEEGFEIKKAKTIKVTGTLNDKVGKLLCQCMKMREVAVLDLSEAVVDDHLWMKYYGVGQTVIIPNNCKYVSLFVDYHCKRRTQAFVATADNPYCKTVDGVLYTKDGTTLIAYPPAKTDKTFYVPSEVREIGYLGLCCSAFMRTRHLERLVINDGCLKINYGGLFLLKELKRIEFGNILQTLDDGAIVRCDALEEIILPSSLKKFTENATNCFGLKEIKVEDESGTFCSIDGVLYNKKTSSLVLCPHYYQKDTLTIPEGVKKILDYSICGCTNLRHLHFPKSLESIKANAINDCSGIESISVEDGNKHFYVDGGILYNANRTRLIYCPPLLNVTEVVVPETVEKIEGNAFSHNQNIRRLILPDSVKEVGFFFINNTNIKEVRLPKNLPVIAKGRGVYNDSQHIGFPRKGKKYKRLLLPSGSKVLYEADRIWREWREGFVEQ